MRRFHLLSLLLTLAACGGGSGPTGTTPPPPPPPPPAPPGPPASLSIQAGDAQEAAPGAAVPTKPMVVVRDAQGRPAPGAPVSFAVQSGGGSIEQSGVTSGADGTASPGNWTLGPAEGDNRLTATVGGLPSTVITATARYPVVRVVDQTVGPGGGTISYAKPGDPLDGLTLTVPAGAYAASSHWTIEYQPAASGLKKPGLHIGAPVINITSDQGLAAKLLTLKIPMHITADSAAGALYYDAGSGNLEPIPVIAADANSITLGTRHFSANLLTGANGPTASFASQFNPVQTGVKIIMTLQAIDVVLIQGVPIVSDFDPAFDIWEFGDHGSYVTPVGHMSGMSLSAFAYFLDVRAPDLSQLPLKGRYAQGPVWPADPLGYRIAALAEADVNWPGAVSVLQSMPTGGDRAEFLGLATSMYNTRKPSLISITGPSGTRALIAYEVHPDGVLAADPNTPGQHVFIPFNGTSFQPIQFPLCFGTCLANFTSFHVFGDGALVDLSPVRARFGQLPGGPVGAQQFPDYTIQYFDEDLLLWKDLTGSSLSVNWATIQLRAKCAACAQHIPGVIPADLVALDIYDAGVNRLASDQTTGVVKFKVPGGNSRIGVHVLGGVTTGGVPVWRHVDFKYLQIGSSKISISPDPANGLSGTPLALTANNLGTNPPHVRYLWSFNDNTTASIDDNNTVLHTWKAAGSYTVAVIMVDLATNLDIGRATGTVLIDQPIAAWRLDSWQGNGVSITPHSPGCGGSSVAAFYCFQDADFVDGLLPCPGCGLIVYLDQPLVSGGKTFPAGVYFQYSAKFPLPLGLDATQKIRSLARANGNPPLATDFTESLVIDALTAAGDLTAGTFSGKAVYDVYSPQTPPGMAGTTATWWTISAVKNGNRLTGTITKANRNWYGVPVNQVALAGDDVWTFTFTATRVK